MGTHTPRMNPAELASYLDEHLKNEIEWLLRAATEWHVQKTLALGIDGYSVQVYAMDSVFLHARTLFEFFTPPTSDNYYGCRAYEVKPLKSHLYTGDWCNPLHAYIMHAQDRSSPQQLLAIDGTTRKDLKEMPVDMAMEIVRLWKEFAARLARNPDPTYTNLSFRAEKILATAKDNAARVAASDMATSRGIPIPPISW